MFNSNLRPSNLFPHPNSSNIVFLLRLRLQQITQDEIVASVKSLMNTRIADPLDTEGSALLMKVRGDLAAKYDGNQDGVIERAEALAAWAKYSAGGGKDEL